MDNGSSGVETNNVRIVFFAKARELSGFDQSKIIVNGRLSYDQLVNKVIDLFGLESIRDTLILAVNEEFVERDAVLELTERDEIADKMETPKDIVKLQHEKLQLEDIIDSVASPSCGAISTFIGTTRDNFEGKKVLKLEYEAYESMALKEMKNICDQVRSKWNVKHVAIHHRLGEVAVSEASVAIAISSPHRLESLRAVEFTIDTLKAKVPIWKKEIYENTEPLWKENTECPWSNNDATVDSKKNYQHLEIDPSQVQIRADNEELNRRIEAFIARKRQQVNAVNVQEFCSHRYLSNESEGSCARVDAILIRRKDSKSHVKEEPNELLSAASIVLSFLFRRQRALADERSIKVSPKGPTSSERKFHSRVLNSRGPQIMDPLMLFAKTNKSSSRDASESHEEYPALDERLSITEKFLRINKPVPKDIYERIKNIENKVLYLESLSPEYKDFWVSESADNLMNHPTKPIRKRIYSTAELDSKLLEFEDRYAKKKTK